jgi:hypothetical protein
MPQPISCARSLTVSRAVRSHAIAGDLFGQGEDIYISPAVRPNHRTAEAICVPVGFIGVFGFENLPDPVHSVLS